MPRAPFRRKSGTRETNQLGRLAEGLASSKSRAEDIFWERELEAAITTFRDNNDEEAINRALDKAHDAEDDTFDALAEAVESPTGSMTVESELGKQRVTLFCAPILVWGRAKIPTKTMTKQMLANLSVQLGAHVFASKAKIALADYLFAPDQLPHSYSESREMLSKLADAIRALEHVEWAHAKQVSRGLCSWYARTRAITTPMSSASLFVRYSRFTRTNAGRVPWQFAFIGGRKTQSASEMAVAADASAPNPLCHICRAT
jgi:hypothetical protein